MKPIYLFADSQLLFWQDEEERFLDSLREQIERPTPLAAYVGASNGDDPSFYSIFQAAMEGIGIRNCCQISSALTEAEASFVNDADLILLAGGDAEKGWRVFQQNGLKEIIVRRFAEGALLIGVSAGAVQLGTCGWTQDPSSEPQLFETFKLAPFIIDAHDEKNDWRNLRQAVQLSGASAVGIGIPAGGGLSYDANGAIEPIRRPAIEFSLRGDEIAHSLLLPPGLEATADEVEQKWIF